MSESSASGMKAKRKSEALWLMSFSDMSLSLLAFFVLLLSLSSFDKAKYDNMTDGMKSKDLKAQRHNLSTLADALRQKIQAEGLQDSTDVLLDVDGLRVEFKNNLLFQSGSADPAAEFAVQVNTILKILATAQEKYSMTIEGHTDDAPLLSSKKFKDNWGLSAGRGFAILHALEANGIASSRLSVLALAHGKPKVPVQGLKGKSLENARSLNRRVVVHIR